MTFDELLAQVVELLQRQDRVSYGALKRRFALDDAYLQDLKDELSDARRVAIDEDGKVLAWVGEAKGASRDGWRCPPYRGSRSVFPQGHRDGPAATGEVAGATGSDELGPPLATTRKATRSTQHVGRDLQLIHRRI
jgi:hypothetical protein